MSPTPFQPKREILNNTYNNNNHALCPPPLKVHKDSHSIKKALPPPPPPPPLLSSSSASTSSATTSTVTGNKPQQRHPVIIYTHSPKVIHTHPRDFMALVQKLTGLSRSDNDAPATSDTLQPKQEPGKPAASTLTVDKDGAGAGDLKKGLANEDNETSSVITEENNCSSSIGDAQVNSCFMPKPPMLDPSLNPYMTNLPVFASNSSADYLCSNQPFLNYDPLFFPHNMRSSMNTSSATLDGMNDFREY